MEPIVPVAEGVEPSRGRRPTLSRTSMWAARVLPNQAVYVQPAYANSATPPAPRLGRSIAQEAVN